MQKSFGLIVLAVFLFALIAVGYAHGGYDHGSWNGSYEGHGMMGGEYSRYSDNDPPCWTENRRESHWNGDPIDHNEAEKIAQRYVKQLGNKRLTLGSVRDNANIFEADIVTAKEKALVETITISKKNGRIYTD